MLIRRMPWTTVEDPQPLVYREWLVTNGLGGYASGTVAGVITRRYHGLLIAALPAPLGRTVMLSHLSERMRLPGGREILVGGEERVGGALELHGAQNLAEFRLEGGLPVWRYEFDGVVIERMLLIPHLQNTVHITYRLIRGDGPGGPEAPPRGMVRLKLRPSVHFRPHEAPVSEPLAGSYRFTSVGDRCELYGPPEIPPLRMCLFGDRQAFTCEGRVIRELLYRVEESRGYESAGDLWSPGYFRADLSEGHDVTLVASTEDWQTVYALTPDDALQTERDRRQRLIDAAHPAAREGVAAELVLAADQFVIRPAGRAVDAARAHAEGDDVRTVIAGYHWFTDWGRDTMISLEGLTLTTGRAIEAGWILRTFAHYVRDGLIPNMFPEGHHEGLYHTADATMWFFHAVDRYLDATGDRATLRRLVPVLRTIVERHIEGTRFGIGVDPDDGLLRQGAEGYQLTWMDAKVDDWVVTPRRGKAVEINALWYNALRLLAGWIAADDPRSAAALDTRADQVRSIFNQRFWYADGEYLYDVLDGEQGHDPACRPNQILALSLKHPVLDAARWERVLDVVADRLVTPVGLRSLAPGHPDYKAQYYGDLRARDAAYHQGTVWGWLAGPLVDAWLRVRPNDVVGARRALKGFVAHLDEACIGSISEIFDAEAPYTPRGCIAQAWSVAEVLRCWVKTAAADREHAPSPFVRSAAV
jgi:predicted glycogen debranching enzyme